MTAFLLPVDTGSNQIQSINLEGSSYQYSLKWNTRDEAWYFSITRSGNLFEFSSKLTVGFDILDPWRYKASTPEGAIIIYDSEKVTGRIGRDNLGTDKRFKLWYETSDTPEEESLVQSFYRPQR